jgi:hypothetical protein
VADVILPGDREDGFEHVVEMNEYGKYQLMKAGMKSTELKAV